MHEPFIHHASDADIAELADIIAGLHTGEYRFEPSPRQRWTARVRLFLAGAPVLPETRERLRIFSGLVPALPIALLLWVALYHLVTWAL